MIKLSDKLNNPTGKTCDRHDVIVIVRDMLEEAYRYHFKTDDFSPLDKYLDYIGIIDGKEVRYDSKIIPDAEAWVRKWDDNFIGQFDSECEFEREEIDPTGMAHDPDACEPDDLKNNTWYYDDVPDENIKDCRRYFFRNDTKDGKKCVWSALWLDGTVLQEDDSLALLEDYTA